MGVELVTFGCRLNTLESETMRRLASENGLDGAIIINTCAVTSEATRQARQTIRRLRRENPDAPIIVTGCAAQTEPEMFAAMPEVTRILGNSEKMQAQHWAETASSLGFGLEAEERVAVNDIMAVTEQAHHLVDGLTGRSRAFVQVQNGCDHRCTFCIIPYGRGNSRSVPMGEIVSQVRHLVEKGYAEVVLTGVDLTSYGKGLPGQPSLGALVQAILKHVPELPRLRLSSIDSVEVDEALMRSIAEEERLMPHLHLSLQAGDDMILKRMKRRHLRDDSLRFVEAVRRVRPDMVFGADLIAGFPTETEEMFVNSLKLVDDCGLTFVHVFPYSPRPGTPAARMPQVAKTEIKARAARLRDKASMALSAHLDTLKGQSADVLVESDMIARTRSFVPVKLAREAEVGAITRVTIMGHDGERALAS